ncbi:MAG: bifunctional DNA-formamidopyrimidine glycosylase/DNA-(apurinic or apyrimidinic site) lyase [Spirochaetota bacterium]
MPELPEVETTVRNLVQSGLIGSRVSEIDVLWERSIQGETAACVRSRLIGCTLQSISRRGKYLWFQFSGRQHLLVHLRMSGSFRVRGKNEATDSHERVLLHFGERVLAFSDMRKFGRMLLTACPEEVFDRLGVEPFDDELTPEVFYTLLSSRKRMIKALLLDQTVLAGLGNIYTDEALHIAGIHPKRVSNSLQLKEAVRLLDAIRTVLSAAIANGGTSLGEGRGNFLSNGIRGGFRNYLQVFQRGGDPCPRCGTLIKRTKVSQRSTCYCPQCQPLSSAPQR